MLLKILNLYKNYEIYKHLNFTKKGIFIYISFLIKIVKVIVTHPIYIYYKYIFNILLIFEGVLIVIYYTDFSIPIVPLEIINWDQFREFLVKINKKILIYIRDKLNYIIGEQTVLPKEDINLSSSISLNDSISKSNTNNSYILWFCIITIVTIAGITFYYHVDTINYSDLMDFFNHFKGNSNQEDNSSIIDSENDLINISPTESTPRASALNSPTTNSSGFNKYFRLP